MAVRLSLASASCLFSVSGRALAVCANMTTANIESKFRASLIGAVLGDCLGAEFEMAYSVNTDDVVRFFKRINDEKDCEEGKKTLFHFTDDTAMARSVARSLICHKKLDLDHMARSFVDEYNKEPTRGYGANVGNVFKQLKEEDFKDVFGPSKSQFNGSGSYGNGAAMRIAPAALFGFKLPTDSLKSLVEDISLITHSNKGALCGAILECLAVRQALQQDSGPASVLDTDSFLSPLMEQMQQLEAGKDDEQTFTAKLRKIQEYLKRNDEVTQMEIEDELGTDVSALGSVPAALYSFLICNKPVSSIQTENPFERTLMYAISLGGDTDTIATMACAIAGAYYGMESIPKHWISVCEGVEDAQKYADEFHKMATES